MAETMIGYCQVQNWSRHGTVFVVPDCDRVRALIISLYSPHLAP